MGWGKKTRKAIDAMEAQKRMDALLGKEQHMQSSAPLEAARVSAKQQREAATKGIHALCAQHRINPNFIFANIRLAQYDRVLLHNALRDLCAERGQGLASLDQYEFHNALCKKLEQPAQS